MSLSKRILSGVTTLLQTGFYHLKVIQYFFSKFLEIQANTVLTYIHTVIHFGTQTVLDIICLPTKICLTFIFLSSNYPSKRRTSFFGFKAGKNTEMNGKLPFIQKIAFLLKPVFRVTLRIIKVLFFFLKYMYVWFEQLLIYLN